MNACSAGSVFRRVQSPIKALAFRRGSFTQKQAAQQLASANGS